MGKYEILYIVHPDLEASIDKITDRVRGFIESRGGKITYEENWGKRKLAYEIRKTDVGIYVLWYFESPKESLAKIERDLRLTEEVMRFMVLAKEDKLPVAAKPKKEVKEEVEEPKKPVKKTETKKVEKKEKPVKVEDEKARLKKLDEKLDALLGDEKETKK